MEILSVVAIALSVVAIGVSYSQKPTVQRYIRLEDETKIRKVFKETFGEEVSESVNKYLTQAYDLSRSCYSYEQRGAWFPHLSVEEKLVNALADRYQENHPTEEDLKVVVVDSILNRKNESLNKAIVGSITEPVLDEIIERIKRKQL